MVPPLSLTEKNSEDNYKAMSACNLSNSNNIQNDKVMNMNWDKTW